MALKKKKMKAKTKKFSGKGRKNEANPLLLSINRKRRSPIQQNVSEVNELIREKTFGIFVPFKSHCFYSKVSQRMP